MKRFISILILSTLFQVASNAQNQNDEQKNQSNTQPKTNIKVNKEYDKEGNLIKYDSTYTYYYSNSENSQNINDSVLNDFKKQFHQQYFFSDEPFFNNFFFQDSLMNNNFFSNDYFSKRFKDNMESMDKLFQQMDSLKNEFFLKPTQPEDKKQKTF
ncbi:MAG: hypothetical protein WCH34_07280 [Bacteroidota bacterium]